MASEPHTHHPDSTDTDTQAVPFAAPTTPYRRSNCVRLRLPGVDDRSERLALADHIDLTKPIEAIFEAGSGLNLLEYLTFPGSDQQEYLFCGQSPRAPSEATQQRIPDHATVGTATTTGGVHGTIASRLASHLPEEVGIERCDLGFAPVGVSSTPTSRLVIYENRTPTALPNLGYNPFVRTLRALESDGWPYLFQTLLRRHGSRGGYTASVRLAVFFVEQEPSNYWERWLINDAEYDLAEIYLPAGFTSNQQSYRLHTEDAEYWDLLRGRDGYSEMYPELVGYPKMPVRPAHLPMLLGVLPLYYERDRWGPAIPRDPPALVTQELIRAAAGTNQGHGQHTAPTAAAPSVMNEGGAEHQSLQAFTAQWFREQGHEVTEIAQDTASRPDLRCDTGEETLAIEIESKNTSKPANLLTNVARADTRGRRVVLVLGSAKAATWAATVVQEPFRDPAPTDTGTLLYNWTAPVRTDDGAVVLLPEGVETARWRLTHEGTLRLEADGRTLGAGSAEAGVTSFAYDTPRFNPGEDRVVVETPGGAPNGTYASKGALTNDWTIVRVPHVPTRLNYLQRVRIMYHDGTTLRTFQPTADWDVSKNSRRYEGAVRAFLDTYTITADGTELAIDGFREQALEWYRQVTDRDPPDRAWFGRSIPDGVDRKRRKVGDTERSFFADRTWRYPSGLQSPDLPGVTPSGEDGGG